MKLMARNYRYLLLTQLISYGTSYLFSKSTRFVVTIIFTVIES